MTLISDDVTESSIAGWYADPVEAGLLRWWTGEIWTGQTAPAFGPPAPSVPPTSAPRAVPPMSTGVSSPPVASRPRRTASGAKSAALLFRDESGFVQLSTPVVPVSVFTPQRPTRVNTTAIWLLAILPVIWAVAERTSSMFLTGADDLTLRLTVGATFVLLSALCAVRDGHTLRAAGHSETASVWWMLLSPFAFLLARIALVRLETGVRASAPLVLWLLMVLPAAVSAGLLVWIATLLPSMP